jgi:hypothetical protein
MAAEKENQNLERKDSTSAQPPAIEYDELNENDVEAVNGAGGLPPCTLWNTGCAGDTR